MDKVAMLKEILAQDPANSFARYGLAMEYASQGDIETSVSEFAGLLAADPNYTPGYFMLAQTLAKAGRTGEAKARLRDGIASAIRTGNTHAQGEMQEMLDGLEI